MTVHDHSRWGATDQIGAANLLTVEKRLTALHSVRACSSLADRRSRASRNEDAHVAGRAKFSR